MNFLGVAETWVPTPRWSWTSWTSWRVVFFFGPKMDLPKNKAHNKKKQSRNYRYHVQTGEWVRKFTAYQHPISVMDITLPCFTMFYQRTTPPRSPGFRSLFDKTPADPPGTAECARFGDSDFEGLMNFDEWEPDEAVRAVIGAVLLCFAYPLVNQHSYWKWPFIVDFPIKNGDFP